MEKYFNYLKFLIIVSIVLFTKVYADFDPHQPESSGYQIVFQDNFTTSATIDINDVRKPNYCWFTGQFYNGRTLRSSALTILNSSLILKDSNKANMGICTAAPIKNNNGFVGRAWGGGAYFVARFKFNPSQVNTRNGWPSFWSLAIEQLASKGKDQWINQERNYEHFIEDDFFEYDTSSWKGENSYGTTLHDSYGIFGHTCPHGFCHETNANAVVKTPSNTDFTEYHTYSQLWIPSANDNYGCINNYFDGQILSQVTWKKKDIDLPPPQGDSIFSIIDQDHLAIFLGTGNDQPMTINLIQVWQIPGQGKCIGDCDNPKSTY